MRQICAAAPANGYAHGGSCNRLSFYVALVQHFWRIDYIGAKNIRKVSSIQARLLDCKEFVSIFVLALESI